MKNLITTLGIISGIAMILGGISGLFAYIFLVHPTGDTLANISMVNWIISIIISIAIVIIGILTVVYTVLLRKTMNIKYGKLISIFGGVLIAYDLYSFISLMILFPGSISMSQVSVLVSSFLMSPLVWGAILAVVAGILGIRFYKNQPNSQNPITSQIDSKSAG